MTFTAICLLRPEETAGNAQRRARQVLNAAAKTATSSTRLSGPA